MNNPNSPVSNIPSGLVTLATQHSPVQVGLLDGNRMFAQGFDVRGAAPNHYRMVPYGAFGVVFCCTDAIEIRVHLDNALLVERKLHPAQRSSPERNDIPSIHYVTENDFGLRFIYKEHSVDLSNMQIVAEQIHPGMTTPPPIAQLDNGAPPTQQFKWDLDPAALGFTPIAPSNSPGQIDQQSGNSTNTTAQNVLSQTKQDNLPTSPDPNHAAAHYNNSGDNPQYNNGTMAIDLANRSLNWAPSHGLVVVGVRTIQQMRENEPPIPPSAYCYCVFQLNPWALHNQARAMLQNRIRIPSQEQLRAISEGADKQHNTETPFGSGSCFGGKRKLF